MKKLIITGIALLLPMLASAYEEGKEYHEEADYVDDNGYFYQLNLSDLTAMITYTGGHVVEDTWRFYKNGYSGDIVIPSSFVNRDDGLTYTVTGIDEYAFYYCKNLTSVEIPNSVTSIGSNAFYECTGLTSINITNSVTSIGSGAFRWCTGLTSITIPNSVTSIGGSAFSGCSGLTSITIPNSVTSIGEYAFLYTGWYDNQPDGLIYAGKVAYQYKGTMPDNTSITIKDGTVGIAGRAFQDCSGLTSISIPNSVTSIGLWAFYNCSGLTSITIPNSVTTIDGDAFYGTGWYNNQPDGLVYAGNVAYRYKGTMPNGTSITIKDGTVGIAGSAFYNCSGLTSITIPNNVTNIGNDAFGRCSGLTSITIPNSVTSIGGGAFGGCSGLTSITIPSSVTSIYVATFSNCENLTSVEIPNSVTSIGDRAFCYSGLTSITIPSSVTSIGLEAFRGCSNLMSVTIPNANIGRSAFEECISLMSVIIGNGVTYIGQYAFGHCENLSSVKIGSGIKKIDEVAFANNYYLSDVYCMAVNVPSTDRNAFLGSGTENDHTTLHVPASAIDAYKTTVPWSEFGEFKTLSGEAGEPKKCATPTISFENGEIIFSCETEGVEYISNITAADAKAYYDGRLKPIYKFKVTVYATKVGFYNSDTTTAEFTATGVFGDLNGDGKVDVADHVELTKIIMHEE